MFDSCEIRIHPTGKAIARFGTKSQGQGHETTYAQIVAQELGIPAAHIQVEEGDTDTAPYGLGTYASRSTPTAGAAGAMAARKIRDKARKIAAYLLEASEEDLEWEPGKFSVRGSPDRGKTIQEIAFAAYTNHPQGMEAGLEATHYYDPPNLTFPFGSYIAVVDIDKGTGEVKVRRFGRSTAAWLRDLHPRSWRRSSTTSRGTFRVEASWTISCRRRWRRPRGRSTGP